MEVLSKDLLEITLFTQIYSKMSFHTGKKKQKVEYYDKNIKLWFADSCTKHLSGLVTLDFFETFINTINDLLQDKNIPYLQKSFQSFLFYPVATERENRIKSSYLYLWL